MSETHTEHHSAPHHVHKEKLSTPLAIIISAVILSVGMMGYGYITTMNNSSTPGRPLFSGKAIDGDTYVEGDKDSKVVVVEYSDPECPYCMMFHGTMKQIRAEYKDKIAFVYRHFPLTQIHPLAFDEARAISCAGKIGGVGKYYAYLDAYYDMRMSTWQSTKSQQPPELTVSGKEELIKTASIDSTSFSSCMTNNETSELVKTSILDGQTITADGSPVVSGTPSTYVLKKGQNGYEVVTKIDGARPYEFVKAAIDQALLK